MENTFFKIHFPSGGEEVKIQKLALVSTTLTPPENIISLTTSRATAVFPGEFFQ